MPKLTETIHHSQLDFYKDTLDVLAKKAIRKNPLLRAAALCSILLSTPITDAQSNSVESVDCDGVNGSIDLGTLPINYYIRSGPSTSDQIAFNPGTYEVEVLGEVEGNDPFGDGNTTWFRVRINGEESFIHSSGLNGQLQQRGLRDQLQCLDNELEVDTQELQEQIEVVVDEEPESIVPTEAKIEAAIERIDELIRDEYRQKVYAQVINREGVTFDYARRGYVYTDPETEIEWVWRPGMSRNNFHVENGWVYQAATFYWSERNMRIINEFQGTGITSNHYTALSYTQEMNDRFSAWAEEHIGHSLDNQTIIIQHLGEYYRGDASPEHLVPLYYNERGSVVEAIGLTRFDENTIFVRSYDIGSSLRGERRQADDEYRMSGSIVHALWFTSRNFFNERNIERALFGNLDDLRRFYQTLLVNSDAYLDPRFKTLLVSLSHDPRFSN